MIDMVSMDSITRFHGKLSDLKATWFPFLFLKPASASVPITHHRLLLMIPCFASWLLVGWLLREWIVGQSESLHFTGIARVYGYMLSGFALWFNLVTKPLWNRRARCETDQCN